MHGLRSHVRRFCILYPLIIYCSNSIIEEHLSSGHSLEEKANERVKILASALVSPTLSTVSLSFAGKAPKENVFGESMPFGPLLYLNFSLLFNRIYHEEK